MGDRVIHLVRHGHYTVDEESAKHGHLTPLGKRQAERTGRRLAELAVDGIYHSDLPRAVETAAIISKWIPDVRLHSTKLLREICPPTPHIPSGVLPEELSWKFGRAQVDAAFEQLLVPVRTHKDRHEIFVTHGNFIRYLIRRLLNDTLKTWVYYGTLQCGISTILIRKKSSSPCLLCYNDIGHLPKAMQTAL